MSKYQQLRATAYHEAGHAVAAYVQGIGIGRKGVSVVRDGDTDGRVYAHKGFNGNPEYDRSGTRLGAERRTVVTLAGEAAQRKFRVSSVRRYHAGSDWDNAVNLMSHFVASDRELSAYLELLRVRAEQLVENPECWAMIDAVATALMEHDTLSAAVVKTICKDVNRTESRTASRVAYLV
jgi:hypothetical protein